MALVSYYMQLDGSKPPASQAKQALATLLNTSDDSKNETTNQISKLAAGTALGALTFASPILGTVLAAASLAVSKQVGAFSLFAKTNKSSLFEKAIKFINS